MIPRIHCLAHSNLGGDIHLPIWARKRGYPCTETLAEKTDDLPKIESTDCLVVLGGPMSAWHEHRCPWLTREKQLLESFIRADKPVVGICLGAQLLADVLGARTYSGANPEIGWFPLESTTASRCHSLSNIFPDRFEAFLWHEDTFDIPKDAAHLVKGEYFANQAFAWNSVIAFQFHLEATPDWVRRLCNRDADKIVVSETVQSVEALLEVSNSRYLNSNLLLERLLDTWLHQAVFEADEARI